MMGTAIYVLFRKPVWFTHYFISETPLIRLPENGFSYFLLYNLPDALWDISLLCYISTSENKYLRTTALLIGPLYEAGQLTDIIPGTFDILDMTVYFIVSLIFILQWKKNNHLCYTA